MTVDELQVLITANTNELRKELGNTNKKLDGLKKSAEKSTAGVKTAFKKLATGIAALGIGKIISESIQSGMDAIESDSLFETSLGNMADDVRAWSDEVSNTLGLNAVAVRKNTGTIFNMTSSMGLAEDNALKMAKGISVLSEDMASFYNLSSEEAFTKLRAGITGEAEGLKALGILVDENTVKQVAYSAGIAQNGAELTQQEKVLARYVAILQQTGNAQGDLARTIQSPSNQLRILKNQITQLGITFSNFLMPIVSAVLPYLTAFTKVVSQAVSGLAAFFGMTGGGDVSDDTKNISTNAGNISSGLDNANDSAKKLKKTMAGFDEMNVLQEQSDSSASGNSSGGTSTVGLNFDLSEYDAHLDWVSSETEALVEKIKGWFSGIGDGINFDNLVKAFKNLKKAVEPIAGKIWDGLKWAYDNILKPLAQWTIGEAVPAFLNGVSGCLEFLNPFLESFMNLGGWLWDSFLQPIATWTGGVIVDTLNGVGGALTAIGEWASANQGVIDAMVNAFAIFFGLWKLTELLAFIGMSGGLVGAFGAITAAIWSCTGAKIADKLETVALTAMYAKDFIVSIAKGTVEIVKQTGAWIALTAKKAWDAIQTGVVTVAQTVWNGICVAATAVTTALGAAFTFLTSPIGLVVLAIAAVIAIVVVCIKYWDEIKEVASKCWDGIKAVWNKVSEWFKKNIVEPIKKTFSDLWDGVKGIFSGIGEFFSGVWEGVKSIFKKAGQFISDTVGGAFKSAINAVLTTAVNIINGFIKAINFAISLINAIPGVNISKLDLLEVPKMAKGGVVDRATLAVVGEAGKEAVMPLERNTGWIDQLATKIGEKLGGGAGGMNLTVKLGEEKIFDKFIEYGREKAFETNGEVVFV